MFETISSVQNSRIKHLVRLRDSSHRRRQRRFLIEGLREIERALACGWPIESLYFCEDFFAGDRAYAILDQASNDRIEVVKLAPAPFRKAAYRQSPDGLLAVGHQKDWKLESLPCNAQALFIILEGLEKPGNLGAILRTANAAGADGLILINSRTDAYNPNAIRASQGAFFDLPFYEAENEEIEAWLRKRGIEPICTSPLGNHPVWEADLTKSVALLMGAENTGLSDFWLKRYPSYRLPMKGITDSLNISSTTAICLFEAIRQRQP